MLLIGDIYIYQYAHIAGDKNAYLLPAIPVTSVTLVTPVTPNIQLHVTPVTPAPPVIAMVLICRMNTGAPILHYPIHNPPHVNLKSPFGLLGMT